MDSLSVQRYTLTLGGIMEWQTLRVARSMYSRQAVLRAAFHFTDKAYFHLDSDIHDFIVGFLPKTETGCFASGEFLNELLFQTVREQIAKETKDLRVMLTARSLSSAMVMTKPQPLPQKEEKPLSSPILSDWFATHHV